MKPGTKVILRCYGEEQLVRRVIKVLEDVVIVCQDDEYLAAQREGRDPLGVGFNIKYVLGESKQDIIET